MSQSREPESVQQAKTPITARLRGLPTEARWMLLGISLFSLGTGLTLPFLFVYLHDVRGISTPVVGLVIGWVALAGLAAAPLWGTAIDRFGPRSMLLTSLSVESLAVFLLAFVTDVPQAFGVATLLAIGGAGAWPSQAALLARLVPSETRPWLFGIQFMLLNLGIGLGGLISAVLVDVDRPSTFQLLYFLDALSYLSYMAVLFMLPRDVGKSEYVDPDAPEQESTVALTGEGGYRELIADRAFLRVVAIATLLVLFGYAQIEVGLTAYATQVADVPARWLGIAFATNTGTIVIGQLFVLSWLEGRSRSRALAACGGAWAVSWLVIAAAGAAPTTLLLLGGLALGTAIFALGETIWSPVLPALVNDMAPPHLRGRYNAVSSLAWNLGSVLGPVYAGVLIGAGLGSVWVIVTVVGCLLGAVAALSLHGRLTPVQDGRPQVAGATMGG